MRFKTSMLRSGLYNYREAYIIIKSIITVVGTVRANGGNKNLTFKNNAPFLSCILKTNNIFIDNAGDCDIVLPKYIICQKIAKIIL